MQSGTHNTMQRPATHGSTEQRTCPVCHGEKYVEGRNKTKLTCYQCRGTGNVVGQLTTK